MRISHFKLVDVAVLSFAIFVFGLIIFLDINTDIQKHLGSIRNVKDGSQTPPVNFLYYLTVYTTAFFSTQGNALEISAVIVLSLSVMAKFIISRYFAVQYYQSITGAYLENDLIIINFCLFLLIAFSFPLRNYYLGQIPPNIWHNSTTIFVMPFCLLLFWRSSEQLKDPTKNRIFVIFLWSLLVVLIKPSYFFVFALAYPAMFFWLYRLKNKFWVNMLPIILVCMIVIVMYYLIYKLSIGSLHAEKSAIAIMPFNAWWRFSHIIPLSLLASLIYPLTYIHYYRKDLTNHLMLQYAVVSYIIALLIFILLTETGPREYHGNYFWQCVICSYILFLVVSVLFVDKINIYGVHNFKNKVILTTFVGHVVSGCLYLVKILVFKSYI